MLRRVLVCVAWGLAVVGSGCAHNAARAPEIKDEWVARVPQEQLQPLYQARHDFRASQDEVTRAEVAVRDADSAVSVRKTRLDAAGSRVKAAEQELKAAERTGDPNQIAQARSGLQQARQNETVAQADRKVAEEQRDVAQAQKQLAEARVKTEQARVEQAKYKVLQANNDTRVKDINPLEFDQAITASLNKERDAKMKLQEQQSQVASAEQRLRDARQQSAVGGAGSQGQQPNP